MSKNKKCPLCGGKIISGKCSECEFAPVNLKKISSNHFINHSDTYASEPPEPEIREVFPDSEADEIYPTTKTVENKNAADPQTEKQAFLDKETQNKNNFNEDKFELFLKIAVGVIIIAIIGGLIFAVIKMRHMSLTEIKRFLGFILVSVGGLILMMGSIQFFVGFAQDNSLGIYEGKRTMIFGAIAATIGALFGGTAGELIQSFISS